MIKPISKCIGVCALALAASCSIADDGSHTIDVTEHNDLGVTTLQTARGRDNNGNQVFTLRAFSADDRDLASVRLTTGLIPDLQQLLPEEALGSEIVVSVAGSDRRTITHETQHVVLRRAAASDAVDQFLQLAAVSSALAQEANIFVEDLPANEEQPSTTGGCSAADLLTSPIAGQCCTQWGTGNGTWSIFFRYANNYLVERLKNPNGTACKASDGVSSCLGSACYFGPLGYARASLYSGYTTPHMASASGFCVPSTAGGPHYYADVTGTAARNQGCPGGASGNGAWDW